MPNNIVHYLITIEDPSTLAEEKIPVEVFPAEKEVPTINQLIPITVSVTLYNSEHFKEI